MDATVKENRKIMAVENPQTNQQSDLEFSQNVKCSVTVDTEKISPNSSIKSNNISIQSLDDDDDSSTIADSDSDFEEIPEKSKYILDSLKTNSNGSSNNEIILINDESSSNNIVSPVATSSASSKPSIGSIAVQNSSDITFGNKTFYQGPVTIKQFVLDKGGWQRKDANGGNDNPAYQQSGEEGVNQSNDNNKNTDEKPDQKWHQKLFVENQPILIAITAAAIVLVIGTIILTKTLLLQSADQDYGTGDAEDSRKNIPIDSSIGFDRITENGSILRFIPKSHWLALQVNENTITDLELPNLQVIIAHTATEDCDTQSKCTYRVRHIQAFHMSSQHWSDIGYNFLVGGDGAVYEGRGWDKEGAHTKGYNKRSICIAFIGTFNKITPPKRQLNVAQLLIAEGVKENKLIANYTLYGHRQLASFESPGDKLYEIIKTWPHWSSEIRNF